MDRDYRLVNALSSRQPRAPEELLGTYGGRAYRLALRITRNAADAEEVVQDAFCTIVRKIDAFRRQSAFSSWLYRIVANALVGTAVDRRALEAALASFADDPSGTDRFGAMSSRAAQAQIDAGGAGGNGRGPSARSRSRSA